LYKILIKAAIEAHRAIGSVAVWGRGRSNFWTLL